MFIGSERLTKANIFKGISLLRKEGEVKGGNLNERTSSERLRKALIKVRVGK